MASTKFCANLSWLFTEEADLLKRFAMAAARGFKAVEIAFPYDHSVNDVVKAKEESGVDVILINSGCGKTLGSASNSLNEAAFQSELDQAIKYASALKCKKIHLMAGRVGSEQTNEQARAAFVSNLKTAGDQLASQGMTGVIEPINRYDVPGYFLNDFYQAVAILEEVSKPNIKLQYDFYHQHQMDGGLMHKFNLAKDIIGHIQVSQVPFRKEPFSAGEINYDYVLKALAETGYSGWVGLEYKPSKNTEDSLSGWFKA